MPRDVKLVKIKFDNLPKEVTAHIEQRIRERKITASDLAKWRYWQSTAPHAPFAEWWKDFGTFKLVGRDELPLSVLDQGMRAHGVKLAALIEDWLNNSPLISS